MPSNIPSGFAQATMVFTHPQVPRPVVVTMGLSLLNFTGTNLQAANKAYKAWKDTLLVKQDTECTFSHVDLFIGADEFPSGSVRSSESASSGGSSFPGVPANVATLVNKSTAQLGRRGRGRMYVPFMMAEAGVDEGGNVDSTTRATLNTTLAAYMTSLTTVDAQGVGTLGPVLLHRTVPLVATEITTLTVAPKVGTRKGRIR